MFHETSSNTLRVMKQRTGAFVVKHMKLKGVSYKKFDDVHPEGVVYLDDHSLARSLFLRADRHTSTDPHRVGGADCHGNIHPV